MWAAQVFKPKGIISSHFAVFISGELTYLSMSPSKALLLPGEPSRCIEIQASEGLKTSPVPDRHLLPETPGRHLIGQTEEFQMRQRLLASGSLTAMHSGKIHMLFLSLSLFVYRMGRVTVPLLPTSALQPAPRLKVTILVREIPYYRSYRHSYNSSSSSLTRLNVLLCSYIFLLIARHI